MAESKLQVSEVELEAALFEAARLEAVDRFDVLDTPSEEGFDGIVRLIRNIFHVKIGLVSVIDGHRQWYKACEGLGHSEIPRPHALCDVTVRGNGAVIVPDTRLDARFARHPLVTAEPGIRFYAGVPLRTRDGFNIGTLCAADFEPRPFSQEQTDILVDLARVAMAEFELRQLVTVDALTGILSRRALKDEGARAVALAKRHELDLSCLKFDLDHFREINAIYGHAAGDAVLAGVARECQRLLRRTDHIGRLGGEDFAVVLPHTDRNGAMEAANKLRAAIEGLTFDHGNIALKVTASFGVSSLDAETEDMDTLLNRADAALHEAKSTGRNRCASWRGSEASRHAVRRRVLKSGRLHFNNRMSSIDCTVRTLSGEGAGIDLSSSLGLPERFNLMIRADAVDLPCRIVSQTERHIEVEFC